MVVKHKQPPYNPITGVYADLKTDGVFPYVAMMQIAAEDTHKNYVLCRGFDIRHNRFIDYEKDNDDKPGIPVAKPWCRRRTGVYRIASIYLAVLPMQSSNSSPVTFNGRVGKNPGVASVSSGQPAYLEEEVTEMKDDNDVFINWQLLDDSDNKLMVKAAECITPGDRDKTATVMMWDEDTKCWIEDPTYSEPIDVSDQNGWLLAITDDCFQVEQGDCSQQTYQPAMPFGLTRRVKIESLIECDATGEVTILKNDGTVSTCKIYTTNRTNRPLACDADEYATLHIAPGECCMAAPSPTTAQGWLVPMSRPLRATATITQDMCETDTSVVSISSISYPDVCTWTTRVTISTVENPHGFMACNGDTVLLGWNASTCDWEVLSTPPYPKDVVTGSSCGSCDLTLTTERVGVQSCCEGAGVPVALQTQQVTVIDGVSAECGSSVGYLNFTTRTYCVVGCGTPTTGIPFTLNFSNVDVLTAAALTWDSVDLQIDLDKLQRTIGVLCFSGTTADNDFVQFYDCTTAAPTTAAPTTAAP